MLIPRVAQLNWSCTGAVSKKRYPLRKCCCTSSHLTFASSLPIPQNRNRDSRELSNIMADYEALGQQFCSGYYAQYDANRATVEPFYCDESMYSFEGKSMQGKAAIMKHITEVFLSVLFALVIFRCWIFSSCYLDLEVFALSSEHWYKHWFWRTSIILPRDSYLYRIYDFKWYNTHPRRLTVNLHTMGVLWFK